MFSPSFGTCHPSFMACDKKGLRAFPSDVNDWKLANYSMISMAPLGHCTSHARQTRHSSRFLTLDFSL